MAKLTAEELLFRKVEEKVKKAIYEYGLIADGDRICWDGVPRYTIPALKWLSPIL